jgi:hypothetical protein
MNPDMLDKKEKLIETIDDIVYKYTIKKKENL